MNRVIESRVHLCTDNYRQSIDILTSQGKFYINLGLERIEQILELLGKPQKELQFIHVAGTNGKGSVCAMLSAVLAKSKKQKAKSEEFLLTSHLSPLTRVGLFTSPHVFEYTERIKINDIEIEKEVFAEKIIEITELAQKNEIHLTEFEILTAVAFEYFAQNNVDIVVLETGLGGRLDSTNIIEKNICSIITHIDFDHIERLGDTIEKIAYEKAGIIKPNCPVVISSENAGVNLIKEIAQQKNSEVFYVEEGADFPEENPPLKGTYQRENFALVLKAIEILYKNGFHISKKDIEDGLKHVKHPCRFEYLQEHNILIDGAHNPNGTKALRKSLDYYFPNQKIKFIFGCLRNKNYPEMMINLFAQKETTFTPEVYFYHFDNSNACTYEELANTCGLSTKPFEEFEKEDNILTVICGSFYMIKELLFKMGIK